MGIVPVLGNLYHVTKLIVKGFRDQLDKALHTSNLEAVQLCITNGYLDDPIKAIKAVCQAMRHSNAEVVDLILNAKTWKQEDLMIALKGRIRSGDEANIKKILDYHDRHFKGQKVRDEFITDILDGIWDLVSASKIETVQRVLNLLPHCSLLNQINALQEILSLQAKDRIKTLLESFKQSISTIEICSLHKAIVCKEGRSDNGIASLIKNMFPLVEFDDKPLILQDA